MTSDHPIDPGRQAIVEALERHAVRYVVIGGAGAQALAGSCRRRRVPPEGRLRG